MSPSIIDSSTSEHTIIDKSEVDEPNNKVPAKTRGIFAGCPSKLDKDIDELPSLDYLALKAKYI